MKKKTKPESVGHDFVSPRGTFGRAITGTCRLAFDQLNRVKAAIFAEARSAINAPQHLLRLALNEAEAESWQTDYPHLVFPALAAEKVQSLSAWSRRQQAIRQMPRALLSKPLLITDN